MRAFLDACVLYPPLLRGLLLDAAAAGLYTPLWSPRVLDEWHIAAARDGGQAAEAEVARIRGHLRAAFPGAEVPQAAPEAEAAIALPDPADAHVAAAAHAASATMLITLNLRDFPVRTLAGLGLEVRHPDGVLWELLGDAPGPLASAIRARLPDQDAAVQRRALKRARLPRLGKAWEALAPTLP